MGINPTDTNNIKVQTDRQQFQHSVELESASKPSNGNEKSASDGTGKLSVKEAQQMVDSLSGYMEVLQTSMGFNITEETDRVVVTIFNKETDKIIRQIPSEELIALQEKMKELTGIIFNEIA